MADVNNQSILIELKPLHNPQLSKHAEAYVAGQAKQALKLKPDHLSVGNFMLDLMEAVDKDQTTLSNQQMTDAKSTEITVGIEASLYNAWCIALQNAADAVAAHPKHPDQYNSEYQTISADAQANESKADGAVQAEQAQTSSDATNLQMKAQLVQGVNGILSMLVNLLGRLTA